MIKKLKILNNDYENIVQGQIEQKEYEDCFINPAQFSWMTRNRVREESSEVVEIKKESTLKLLFVQKNAHESEFYFMGSVEFKSCRETTQKNDKGQEFLRLSKEYIAKK